MAVNLTGVDLGAGTVDSAAKASPAHTASTESPESQQAATPARPDVSITSTASILAKLQQTLSAKPAVDRDRVEAVRQALASGQYRVHPEKVASGLVNTESALSSLVRK